MASKPWRVVLTLTFALLSLTACKDVEDLPDIDPVDDPWVEAISNEEELIAGEPAPAPTAVAVNAEAPTPGPGEPVALPVEGDPGAAVMVDPAVAETAKLAGASVPKSTKPGTPSADPGAVVDPAVEPAVVPEPAPAGEPAAAIEPAPAPAPAPAKPAAPAPITMADFDGTYKFSGGSSQEQAVADAIEFGANQVVAIARGIARKRLTKTQIIENPITITVNGDDLKLEWATSGDSMSCVIDGSSTTMSYKGDKYKARARAKDGKLITSFQGPDATKTVVYVLSSDRKTLTVHHKLVADQLTEPVTFKLTYTRK